MLLLHNIRQMFKIISWSDVASYHRMTQKYILYCNIGYVD